jgi:hypothetical protein
MSLGIRKTRRRSKTKLHGYNPDKTRFIVWLATKQLPSTEYEFFMFIEWMDPRFYQQQFHTEHAHIYSSGCPELRGNEIFLWGNNGAMLDHCANRRIRKEEEAKAYEKKIVEILTIARDEYPWTTIKPYPTPKEWDPIPMPDKVKKLAGRWTRYVI